MSLTCTHLCFNGPKDEERNEANRDACVSLNITARIEPRPLFVTNGGDQQQETTATSCCLKFPNINYFTKGKVAHEYRYINIREREGLREERRERREERREKREKRGERRQERGEGGKTEEREERERERERERV